MNNELPYDYMLRPLTEEEGGGWLIIFPDLPGCMSDGETPEDAIKNGEDALNCWLDAVNEERWSIPESFIKQRSEIVTDIPKSMQARLQARAKRIGIAVDDLVTAFVAESLVRDGD